MQAAAVQYIPCPHCQALNRPSRSYCLECGETLAPPVPAPLDSPAETTCHAVPDHFKNVIDELRHHKRHTVWLPCTIERHNSPDTEEALVQDISVGGALFRSDSQWQAGERIRVCVALEGDTFVLPALVKRSCRMLDGIRAYAVAVEFLEPIDAAFQGRVERLK